MNKIKPSEAYLENPVTSKMELFLTIVNGFNPLTIVTKNSILDVSGVLS